ncbi:MAG: hypothetical protein VB143_04240, partial [Burkholderia sp.]
FLGRLHLGGSPIWELGLGNPILSDSRGNRRLQPSTKFGTPPKLGFMSLHEVRQAATLKEAA